MKVFNRPKEGINSLSIHSDNLREYRKSRGESQVQFWSKFGVTQSRGSRFELGTEIPPPIVILLTLYFEGKILDKDLSQF